MKYSLSIISLFIVLASFSVFAEGTIHEIEILNNGKDGPMVFEPGFIRIEKGDTVKFVSVDLGYDSVSIYTPEGAKVLSTRIVTGKNRLKKYMAEIK